MTCYSRGGGWLTPAETQSLLAAVGMFHAAIAVDARVRIQRIVQIISTRRVVY
jgi:hypothetical protein